MAKWLLSFKIAIYLIGQLNGIGCRVGQEIDAYIVLFYMALPIKPHLAQLVRVLGLYPSGRWFKPISEDYFLNLLGLCEPEFTLVESATVDDR